MRPSKYRRSQGEKASAEAERQEAGAAVKKVVEEGREREGEGSKECGKTGEMSGGT